MAHTIRPMTVNDLPAMAAMHLVSDGVQRGDWEQRLTGLFLKRNVNMSFVADDNGRLVGSIFGASTGLRGMIHHLCVDPQRRRERIGSQLIEAVEAAISKRGLKDVAVGIVLEPYRDAFCKHIGYSLDAALPMWQADLVPHTLAIAVPGFEVRGLRKQDGAALSALFKSCGDPAGAGAAAKLKLLNEATLLPMVACYSGDMLIGAALYECSGFRGLLSNFFVLPPFREGLAGYCLLKAGLEKIASFGVLRVLARGYEDGDYRNNVLTNAGFVSLPDERIAVKKLPG